MQTLGSRGFFLSTVVKVGKERVNRFARRRHGESYEGSYEGARHAPDGSAEVPRRQVRNARATQRRRDRIQIVIEEGRPGLNPSVSANVMFGTSRTDEPPGDRGSSAFPLVAAGGVEGEVGVDFAGALVGDGGVVVVDEGDDLGA